MLLRRFVVIQVTREKNRSGCAFEEPARTDTKSTLQVIGLSGFSFTYAATLCVGFKGLPSSQRTGNSRTTRQNCLSLLPLAVSACLVELALVLGCCHSLRQLVAQASCWHRLSFELVFGLGPGGFAGRVRRLF